MDRLFRKRTASTSTVEKSGSRPSSRNKKDQVEVYSVRPIGGVGVKGVEEVRDQRVKLAESSPPSLDLDFRNSLILPALSQRFSVLLPSLSSAPETSIRSLLASQRARQNGPSITEEEEELVLAEIRESAADHGEWDGRPPVLGRDWSAASNGGLDSGSNRYMNGYPSESLLSGSTSSPSILAGRSASPTSTTAPNTGTSSAFSLNSPLPTSTSASSFQTFGGNSVRTKSYGFSGGSAMREGEYLRRIKKSASGRNLNGGDNANIKEENAAKEKHVPLPFISPEKANASYTPTISKRSDSPSGSERTTTPTPSLFASTSSLPRPRRTMSPSAASALNLPPQLPPPSSSIPPTPERQESPVSRPRVKRQSLLAALTPSQVKRISRALEEIEGRLEGRGNGLREKGFEEDEEVLEPVEATDEESGTSLQRQSSVRSNRSTHSEGSSQFPYKMSPTNSAHTVTLNGPTFADSASNHQLPPSPRSHNLLAHVDYDEPSPIPLQPVLTPSKPQPTQHTPSLSSSSMSSQGARYIPGQPRPVGSYHQSEGSISSRAITPSQASPAPSSPSLNLTNSHSSQGRARAGSNPSVRGMPTITPRTTSLGRSRSVNQPGPSTNVWSNPSTVLPGAQEPLNETSPSPNGSVPRHLRPPAGRRLSSPLADHLPSPAAETIPEDDDEESEADGSRPVSPTLMHLKDVHDRRSVADSHRRITRESASSMGSEARHFLGSNPLYLQAAISEVGLISNGESPSPAKTLRRQVSSNSMGSSYVDPLDVDDVLWDTLLSSDSSTGVSDHLNVEKGSEIGDDERVLMEGSGVNRKGLAALQDKLVQKAKAEREALRSHLDQSPLQPSSSTMVKNEYNLAKPRSRPLSPVQGRAVSPPPTSWRFPSHPEETPKQNVGIESVNNSKSEEHEIVTPAKNTATPTAIPVIAPVRAPPPPPAGSIDHARSPSTPHDEPIVFTPSTINLSRQSSTAHQKGQTPPDLDPEKIKDFHARIAAATLALNRTPSRGGKPERKGTTKRGGGAMIISSPQLVSSSVKLPGTPDTPENKPLAPLVEPAMIRALEKTSGSSSKMSQRWRKMTGFRKGNPSFSAEEGGIPYPPTPPATNIVKAVGRDLVQQQQQSLAAPIALRPIEGSSAPADLNTFRFPSSTSTTATTNTSSAVPAATNSKSEVPSPPGTANPTTGLKQMMTRLRRGRSDEKAHETEPTGRSPSSPRQFHTSPRLHNHQPKPSIDFTATDKSVQHSPSPSDDSAVANFISAGRAVGLDDEKLNEMLLQNGMLDRSGTTTSSRSQQSTAPTTTSFSHASPQPDSPALTPVPSVDKNSKGLFRSLSKGRKIEEVAVSSPTPRHKSVEPTSTETAPMIRSEKSVDRVIVRRTILIPTDESAVPSTPTLQGPSPAIPSESPETNSRPGIPRKLSIKRKPLKLSGSDRELVQGSPKGHQRQGSAATQFSGRSDTVPAESSQTVSEGNEVGQVAGLGFLYPPNHSDISRNTSNNSSKSLTGGNGSRGVSGSAGSDVSPGRSSRSRQSSGGGSFYDLYGEGDRDPQEVLHFSPSGFGGERRVSEQTTESKGDSAQAVEITEYADGQVVWSIVDALRSNSGGGVRNSEYSFHSHSRQTSSNYVSSRPGSLLNPLTVENASGVLGGSWGRSGIAPSTAGLNFRHRDKGVPIANRPETNVYFTSPDDVADLIDHLSRDLDTSSRGRIDFNSLPSTPLMPSHTSHSSNMAHPTPGPAIDPAFEDANELPTAPTLRRRAPPPQHLQPTNRKVVVPAGGFSPKRQAFVRGYGSGSGHRSALSTSSIPSAGSPTAASFTSTSTGGHRTVEERLQALLVKLQAGGEVQQAAASR